MNAVSSPRQPSLFIPHGGGPCFFMEWNPPNTWLGMQAFLQGLASSLPQPPRAIVVVSAHWIEAEFQVTAHAQPPLIYDYYNFPPHTYQLQYPAPGDPQLAHDIVQRLQAAGLPAAFNAERGLDHGSFIPLKVAFPDADIPVLQLSLRQGLDPTEHLAAGRALTELRDDNVLILGSGMSFHNMRGYNDPNFTAPSQAFDQWLQQTVNCPQEEREQRLQNWEQAPAATQCHPPGGEEHLTPLFVAAGAGGAGHGQTLYSEVVMQTQISAFAFGS